MDNKKKRQRGAFTLFFIALGAFFLFYDWGETKPEKQYYANQGHIFGTYYNIQYESENDLHDTILQRLHVFDQSLSTFNDSSIISRINRNEATETDTDFEQMFALAQQISVASQGAFDITVAPLVNAWGFGFKHKEEITQAKIDSIRQYIGYSNLRLTDHRLYKFHPLIMLDASAIAKGQVCDVIGLLLKNQGCTNYLVDIGGEVVCEGYNKKGDQWKVGIVKPQDDPNGTNQDLQEVIATNHLCMATSGNYRQFYYENGMRRSHTIDPRTGYPVEHNLLSATVIAPSCMQADALATACMVLGTDSALALINSMDSVACYLIYATPEGTAVAQSEGMKQYIGN